MTLTQITEKGIKDGEIVNADINASAAIAGSKITPTFTSTVNVTNNLPEIFLTDSNSSNARARINANGGGLLLGADNDNAAADSSISFEVDGSNAMFIKDGGNVGIGTITPSRRLQIKSASNNATQLGLIDVDSSNEVFRVGQQSDGDGFVQILDDSGAVQIGLEATGDSFFLGGDVGIGTNTPVTNFEVVEGVTTQSETDKRIAVFRKNGTAVGDEGYIHLTTMTGHYGVKLGYANEGGSPGYLNQGFFISTVHDGENITNHTKRFVLKSDGKIGIGTTSPSEKLTLGDGDLKFFHSNAANAHRTTFIEFGNSSNRITSEANYGSDSSSNYTAGLKFTTKNYNGSAFETKDALNIQANGRVGIGTTSPSQKLTVAYSNGSPWSTSSLGVGMKVENTNAVNGVAAGLELRSFQNNGGASIQYIHAVNDGVSSYGSDLVFSTRVAYTGAYRESCRITNAGSLKFPSGHGIDFSATSDGSGTDSSELFDDYEEGTWTPVLDTNGSGVLSANYTVQTGIYKKIGRLVWVLFDIIVANTPSGNAGYPQITGLPYTPQVGNNSYGGYPIPQFRDSTALPVDARLYNSSYGHSSSNAIWIQYYNSSGVTQQPAGTTFWLQGRCSGEMVYCTA